jgi:hypothetical protein
MARAVKWIATVVFTVATFSLATWLGLLASAWILKAWTHSDREALALAAASLLGTAAFGIGAWWAQRDPGRSTMAAARPEQKVTGTFINNIGFTGNNIGGDAKL